MRRREFITLIGGAVTTWPLVARAQQPTGPTVGFINTAAAQDYKRQLAAFLKGLAESGYVEGQNITIEYRWAEGNNDRLPALVADSFHTGVELIVPEGGFDGRFGSKADMCDAPTYVRFTFNSDTKSRHQRIHARPSPPVTIASVLAHGFRLTWACRGGRANSDSTTERYYGSELPWLS